MEELRRGGQTRTRVGIRNVDGAIQSVGQTSVVCRLRGETRSLTPTLLFGETSPLVPISKLFNIS